MCVLESEDLDPPVAVEPSSPWSVRPFLGAMSRTSGWSRDLDETAGQQRGAIFEAHHGARRFGVACCCRAGWSRLKLDGFVVVDPEAPVVPVSL